MKSSIKTIIFDFDGTLADTLPLCITAYQNTAEEVTGTRPSVAEVEQHFGLNDTGVLAGVLGIKAEEIAKPLARFLEIYRQLHPSLAPAPFPGCKEVLDQLLALGYKLALITGKEACTAEPSLQYYGIQEHFSWFGYGKIAYNAKSELMQELMQEQGLTADEIIYIGDAPSDITSCHDIGVKIINAAWAEDIARYTEQCLALAPDYRLNKLSELVPLIQQI